MFESYVKKILNARVYDVAEKTPLQPAIGLSERISNHVLIKREDLQPIFSFKIRGAYNKLVNLSDVEKAQGVIAASAGNHAQGVALAAEKLQLQATIVMPVTTPAIKVDAVRAKKAKVVLFGDTFAEAAEHAQQLAQKHGYTYAHPYDDPDVIAGQGTVGVEILQQESNIDAIFVPVGGGGLLAGIVAYVKYLRPDIKVIAVEPENAACLKAAIDKGRRVILPEVGIFADGVAVNQIGKETFNVIQPLVDDIVTISSDEICAAIKDIFDDTRAIMEPAGALALAGLKKYAKQQGWKNKTLVAINSGANTNFHRLRHISERTEIGEKREAVLSVTIPEAPGSFQAFCAALGKRSITEFNYRYSDVHEAQIFVGVQVNAPEDRQRLIEQLSQAGYRVADFTDNEVAKLHIRHMVGGHAARVEEEVLYRFEFPERPGALSDFLSQLGKQWNISLFHYRNHGAAYGRALAGFQVCKQDKQRFSQFLQEVNCRLWDETHNEAYQHFLGQSG